MKRLVNACLSLLALVCVATDATVIQFVPTQIAGDIWTYEYSVTNNDPANLVNEFTIYFPIAQYQNLSIVGAPAGWDPLVVQPDPLIPASGFFDALALLAGPGFGETIGGFVVQFEFLGIGTPSSQTFDVLDANFQLIGTGITVGLTMDEPGSMALLALAIVALLLVGNPRQRRAFRGWAIRNSLGFLVFASALQAFAPDARADPTVSSMSFVGESRVSRTVFDYKYRITVTNDATPRSNVVATLTGVGQGTTIIDGISVVGDLQPNAVIQPLDTITVRHDRLIPFNPGAMIWQVTSVPTPPANPGVLLQGPPNAPAEQALADFAAARTAADLATAVDPVGNSNYYRKQLSAVIQPNATVGQVNAALLSVGARVVFMLRANRSITLQVADPGSLGGLQSLAAQLVGTGAFQVAAPLFLDEPADLPINVTATEALAQGGPIYHQVAARVNSAWAALNAVADNAPVEVIVVDFFGNGPATEISGTASGFGSSAPHEHGYHVLGILAGDFGGTTTAVGKITGSLPADLTIHIVDLKAVPSNLTQRDFIKREITRIIRAASDHRFVINLSLGYCNGVGPYNGDCQPITQVNADAVDWRTFVRNIWPLLPVTAPFDFEANVIQVSAAGNNVGADASRASPYNAAVLRPVLNQMSPLSNGLVVENRTTTQSGANPPIAGCRATNSNTSGNIAAIGTNVQSFISPTATGIKSGTSMATPQVAGLVAYMLGLVPDLTVADVISKLKTARFSPDTCGGAPMIDAYASVLSMDEDFDDAPVRAAVMQPLAVNPGAKFTFSDAKLFLQAFFRSAYNLTPIPQPDLSRFDLNGDGYTGDATKRAPFDLKFQPQVAGAPPVLEQLVEYPNHVSVRLDEKSVSDFGILCYYVNSDLFDQQGLTQFNIELQTISNALGRPISCALPTVVLTVNATQPGWSGLPATISLSDFWATTITNFQLIGNSATNTCGPGERGAPLFSASVASDAQFFGARTVVGVPWSGPSINFRNCSSFYAFKNFQPTGQQVWINGTGRARQFSPTVTIDWEYQVRYSNGDPTNAQQGKRCTVGVVPNSGVYVSSFEAASCSHAVVNMIQE